MSSPTEICENAILTYLSTNDIIEDTYPWSIEQSIDPLVVIGAIKSLHSEDYVATEDVVTSFYTLSEEADGIVKNGSQEIIVLKAINGSDDNKLSIAKLNEVVGIDIAKIGMGNCMKSKWIKKDGNDLVALKMVNDVEDTIQSYLLSLASKNYTEDSIDKSVRTY